jgi:hypothetical protein
VSHDYRAVMTAAESAPAPGRPPFADASPAQVRAALLPEDAAEFDRQWQDAWPALPANWTSPRFTEH